MKERTLREEAAAKYNATIDAIREHKAGDGGRASPV